MKNMHIYICTQMVSCLHVLEGWVFGFDFAALGMWSSCFVGMVFGFDFKFDFAVLGWYFLVL